MMTYQPTSGVISFFSDLVSGPSTDHCMAVKEKTTAELDAKTNDLAANWRPTGFYRLDDITKMIAEVMKVLQKSTQACESAIAAGAPEAIRKQLRDWQSRASAASGASLPFITAIQQARQQGIAVIDAPSFKRWVLTSANAASNATGNAAYMSCLKPALVSAIQAIYAAWGVMVSIGKGMVRAAIAAGQAVLQVPDMLATVWKYTKWGSLAVLAYYLVKPRKNPCRSRHRSRS